MPAIGGDIRPICLPRTGAGSRSSFEERALRQRPLGGVLRPSVENEDLWCDASAYQEHECTDVNHVATGQVPVLIGSSSPRDVEFGSLRSNRDIFQLRAAELRLLEPAGPSDH